LTPSGLQVGNQARRRVRRPRSSAGLEFLGTLWAIRRT
jgi:hypothetical protein